MTDFWYPHVTVATVVELDNRFLLVEERDLMGLVLNQPAGHLEHNESLQQAATREALEETGWQVEPTHLLGICVYESPVNKATYVRVSFAARALRQVPNAILDADIVRALWLNYEEIKQQQQRLRSPMVLQDIERYRTGENYGLEMLNHIPLK